MPFYIWRQLALTVLMGMAYLFGAPTDAVTAMIIAVVTTWAVTIGQLVALDRKLKQKVPPGPKRYEVKTWLATSLPIFVVEGFYLLLTYVDILALERFRPPDEVAVYYAAARILAIVAFVYFAIAGATTHKFTQYHVAGDQERLAKFFAETIRWTFWPSLAACALILTFGKPLLSLFGAGFASGYVVMFILAVGMLARAAVGPAERLLNMLGERKQCATIYAIAFAINLGGCVLLIPRFGIEGAAIATSIRARRRVDHALRGDAAPARPPRLHPAPRRTRSGAVGTHACSRSSRLITLPVVVIGMSSMKATSRGYSCADSRVLTKLWISAASASDGA